MSDYTTKATVNLYVNGEKAKQELESQRKLVKDLEIAYANAAASGDKSAKTIQKELSKARRELKSMQSSAVNVADVLKRLDTATPKELKNSLRHLNKELQNMERGSKAWNEQVAKIQAVKKELDSLNTSLATQQTTWQKVTGWVNKWQTMVVAALAVATRVVSVARNAVQSYADMDTAMANTQKFTGMSREGVEQLNEEFKKMDTRTSREGLNELAQAAGRLGKKSVKDVMEFVRAGDIIGVAMDELGDEAPEIISKLNGIFNLENEMGTEKAMLATGSAINTLSQNYAAASNNLVEYSSRMGATGSQTNMAMHEMLAFGTLLDSNNVSMEKSATAMQGVITKMYADPAKFAKTAGLDVEIFTEKLKRSSTEGLMMFIDALASMDQMQLNATLKDLGTAGSGVTQTFQTLAGKSELLKSIMLESKKSFEDATSATEEFNVQNNTVQAVLDKEKKKLHELSVALGKELLPVLKFATSSSTAMMQVMVAIASFINKYKAELLALTASILAYNIAVNYAAIKTQILAIAQGVAKVATVGWTAVTYLSAAAVALFTGRITRATIAFKVFSATLKLSPIGIIATAITATVAGLALWIKRTKELSLAQKQLNDIESTAKQNSAEELATLKVLYDASQDQTRSIEERKRAVEQLQEKYPDYFGSLTTEAILAGNAANEYDRLTTSILNSARARAREQQMIANEQQIAKLEQDRDNKVNVALDDMSLTSQDSKFYGNTRQDKLMLLDDMPLEGKPEYAITKRYIDQVREEKNKAISELRKINEGFAKQIADDMTQTPTTPTTSTTTTNNGGATGGEDDDKKGKNRFKAEEDWKKREEALNTIAYATGKREYEEYMKAKARITAEYYDKILARTDLTETERLSMQAESATARLEQQRTNTSMEIAEEEKRYQSLVAKENERYLNGLTSHKAYTNALELMEMDHLRRMVALTEEGSKERAEAEKKYQDKQLQDKKKKAQETGTSQNKIKEDFFGPNAKDNQSAYDASVEALKAVYKQELALAGNNADEKLRIEEAYQKALIALREKYNPDKVDSDTPKENGYVKGVKQFTEWMQSDGGQAVLGSMDTVISGMSGIFSQMSSMVQAELEMQTAAIEDRYDAEIAKAEGNSYKIAKLEKEKEKEIAKAKNEANKKMFAMQVIQAVAQTAQNALNAYGSASAIPVVGFVMAPIAAAMAVAAGALQIAAIKKQQQASEAQGYAKGGFTPAGAVNEEVGVVHAGEWVASQKLLANPVARPLIDALDHAQRTNTIGSLRHEDVSRRITTTEIMSKPATKTEFIQATPAVVVEQNKEYASTMKKLAERLNEPFVTVNTVTGDAGIKKAQDEYNKLVNNKKPKKWKSS